MIRALSFLESQKLVDIMVNSSKGFVRTLKKGSNYMILLTFPAETMYVKKAICLELTAVII